MTRVCGRSISYSSNSFRPFVVDQLTRRNRKVRVTVSDPGMCCRSKPVLFMPRLSSATSVLTPFCSLIAKVLPNLFLESAIVDV